MKMEPKIRIGLITDGAPQIESHGGLHHVANLLIGDGFHWQQCVEALVAGTVTPLERPQGNIRVVNELGMEEYIRSVVGSEMNPDAPAEFVKAHAVISRSWAMRKLRSEGDEEMGDLTPFGPQSRLESLGPVFRSVGWEEADSHVGFDVCSDDHCQRYQGLQPGNQKAVGCVDATRGEVLTDSDGMIADARFSKCCGGRTELFSSCWADIDYPYLTMVEDPWCDLSDMSAMERDAFLGHVLKGYDRTTTDFHDWEAIVDKSELSRRLAERHDVNIGKIRNMSALRRGVSGRIVTLRIEGSEGTAEIGKELAIRRLLAENCLYSSLFEIEDIGDRFRLHGRGWGHGVGLCQIGAARMAAEGKNYKEILRHYYPGTKIEKLYD